MDNNQEEYYRRLADKLAEECPNPDCICKNDAEPQYIITDKNMTEDLDAAYYEALVERFGEVTSTHSEDLGDFGFFEDTEPEFEFLPDPDDID